MSSLDFLASVIETGIDKITTERRRSVIDQLIRFSRIDRGMLLFRVIGDHSIETFYPLEVDDNYHRLLRWVREKVAEGRLTHDTALSKFTAPITDSTAVWPTDAETPPKGQLRVALFRWMLKCLPDTDAREMFLIRIGDPEQNDFARRRDGFDDQRLAAAALRGLKTVVDSHSGRPDLSADTRVKLSNFYRDRRTAGDDPETMLVDAIHRYLDGRGSFNRIEILLEAGYDREQKVDEVPLLVHLVRRKIEDPASLDGQSSVGFKTRSVDRTIKLLQTAFGDRVREWTGEQGQNLVAEACLNRDWGSRLPVMLIEKFGLAPMFADPIARLGAIRWLVERDALISFNSELLKQKGVTPANLGFDSPGPDGRRPIEVFLDREMTQHGLSDLRTLIYWGAEYESISERIYSHPALLGGKAASWSELDSTVRSLYEVKTYLKGVFTSSGALCSVCEQRTECRSSAMAVLKGKRFVVVCRPCFEADDTVSWGWRFEKDEEAVPCRKSSPEPEPEPMFECP